MSQDFVKPGYVYGEGSTLKSLLGQFLKANPGRREAVAEALGVKPDTFGQWVDGVWTEGLRTRYFHAFSQLTGIDLDRLMVVEAKRRIWSRDPATRAFVTYERFQTRADLIGEIKRLKAKITVEIKDFISPSIVERLRQQAAPERQVKSGKGCGSGCRGYRAGSEAEFFNVQEDQ